MGLALRVLHDAGTVEVQEAQSAVGGGTAASAVAVGTGQIAQRGQVEVVQRSVDGQRVVSRVVAVQVAGFVAGDESAVAPLPVEAQLLCQRTRLAEADHLLGVVAVVGHDVLGIVGPSPLVVIDLGGGYVDLHAVVIGEGVRLYLGRLFAAHDDAAQQRASHERATADKLDACGQLNVRQLGAALEGGTLDALDGRRQHDVAHLGAVLEPSGADVVEADALEILEVGERENIVLILGELAVEPREAYTANACQVDVVGPVVGVVAGGGHVVVGHLLQRLPDALVAGLDDAGHEAVAQLVPRRVGLKPGHLLGHHLQSGCGAFEDTFAQLQLLRGDEVDVVVAVGDEVEQVKVGQILGVGEAGVLKCHVEAGVAVAECSRTVEVGEVDHAQVVAALEGSCLDGVELVVVIHTDVVAELQCALMLGEQVLAALGGRSGDDGVLYLVSQHLVYLLHRTVLVGVGVLAAVVVLLGVRLGGFVDEVLLERLPRLVVEEVLLARGVDDDVELLRRESCEDTVAAEDEALRAHGLRAVAVGLQQQAQLREVVAAYEG